MGEKTNLASVSSSPTTLGEKILILYFSQLQSGAALLISATRCLALLTVSSLICWQLSLLPIKAENKFLTLDESLEHSGHFLGVEFENTFMLVSVFLYKIGNATITKELYICV
jgi:hypothetical protein